MLLRAALASAADLDQLAEGMAPYVRDEVGFALLEIPPVRQVSRAEAQVRWRESAQRHFEVFEHLEPAQAAQVVAEMPTPSFDEEAAYYSVVDKTVYLVDEAISEIDPSIRDLAVTCIMAHELVHALQDQYAPTPLSTDDEMFGFVVEGQASLWGQRACAAARGIPEARRVAVEVGLMGSLSYFPAVPVWRYAEARLWAMAVERDGGRSALWGRLASPPVDFAEVRRALGPWDSPVWGASGGLDRAVKDAIAAEGLIVTRDAQDPSWVEFLTRGYRKDGRLLPVEEVYGIEFEVSGGAPALFVIRGTNTSQGDLKRKPELCRDKGGRWNSRDRLCATTSETITVFVRRESGASVTLMTTAPELDPRMRRVLLAAIAAFPAHSQAEEVLALGDKAPAALPVEVAEPGWPWRLRTAYAAEAAGDPDECVRIAARFLGSAPVEVREFVIDQLLRCAWDAKDTTAATQSLAAVAPMLATGEVWQVAARLMHNDQPALALMFLDADAARADEETNAWRVEALVALGRVDAALDVWRTRPVAADGRRSLAEALDRAGLRAESLEVCGKSMEKCQRVWSPD